MDTNDIKTQLLIDLCYRGSSPGYFDPCYICPNMFFTGIHKQIWVFCPYPHYIIVNNSADKKSLNVELCKNEIQYITDRAQIKLSGYVHSSLIPN